MGHILRCTFGSTIGFVHVLGSLRETEYFTEVLRNISRISEQIVPGPFPNIKDLGTRLPYLVMSSSNILFLVCGFHLTVCRLSIVYWWTIEMFTFHLIDSIRSHLIGSGSMHFLCMLPNFALFTGVCEGYCLTQIITHFCSDSRDLSAKHFLPCS